jgi:hypothetical protein
MFRLYDIILRMDNRRFVDTQFNNDKVTGIDQYSRS